MLEYGLKQEFKLKYA